MTTPRQSAAEFVARVQPPDQWFALIELMPEVSFFVKDLDGRFMVLNRRGCEYCGVSDPADAIGKTDHDFFPTGRADEYRADDRRVIDSGRPMTRRVESAPEAAGSPRLVETSKIPLRDRHGKVIGVAGFSREVSGWRRDRGDLSDVVSHLHQHFGDPIDTPALADTAGLSVSQFERRFRSAFGTSPRQYLIRVRIERAAERLRKTDAPVTDIAAQCGFSDHAHLSRTFKAAMGTTPTQYRKRYAEGG